MQEIFFPVILKVKLVQITKKKLLKCFPVILISSNRKKKKMQEIFFAVIWESN